MVLLEQTTKIYQGAMSWFVYELPLHGIDELCWCQVCSKEEIGRVLLRFGAAETGIWGFASMNHES